MPKEVFAEEIERLLAALDGVASARVVTTPAGTIDHVYVTASHSDSHAIRRGVVAALVSAFGVPVDPWRVQVTQLRSGVRPDEIPQFRVARIEEAVAQDGVAATVQLAWTEGGRERSATGRARGPGSPLGRLRTLGAAAVDAVRDALPAPYRRLSLQQASVVTVLDRPVVLVAVAAGGPEAQELSLGVAPLEDATGGVVAAVLDAVTRWLLRLARDGPPSPSDRRAALEAMRHFVRGRDAGQSGEARSPSGGSGDPVPRESAAREDADRALPTKGDGPDPDVVHDVTEIRPYQGGGAAMAAQHEPSHGSVVQARGARPSPEDVFYQSLVQERIPVHVRCRDGYEIPRALVREVGTYALLVESGGGTELVYKHGIISIRPIVGGG